MVVDFVNGLVLGLGYEQVGENDKKEEKAPEYEEAETFDRSLKDTKRMSPNKAYVELDHLFTSMKGNETVTNRLKNQLTVTVTALARPRASVSKSSMVISEVMESLKNLL